jgi:hypothetical protein
MEPETSNMDEPMREAGLAPRERPISMKRTASPKSPSTIVASHAGPRGALGRVLLAVAVVAAVLVVGTPRQASAAGGRISIATYSTSLVCHDGVCTQTPVPVKYMQVRGAGFTAHGPVFIEVIRLSDFTVADSYATVYGGAKLVVNTAIRFCPPQTSSHLFLVQALDMTTLTYSNVVAGSVCPGSSL